MKINQLILLFIILINSILLQLKFKKLNEYFLQKNIKYNDNWDDTSRDYHIDVTKLKYDNITDNINNLNENSLNKKKQIKNNKRYNRYLRNKINKLTRILEQQKLYS